jgi:hypothetical protein
MSTQYSMNRQYWVGALRVPKMGFARSREFIIRGRKREGRQNTHGRVIFVTIDAGPPVVIDLGIGCLMRGEGEGRARRLQAEQGRGGEQGVNISGKTGYDDQTGEMGEDGK